MTIEAVLDRLKGMDVMIQEEGTIVHSDIVIYKFDWKYDCKERIMFKSTASDECCDIDYITIDPAAIQEIKEIDVDVYKISFNHGQSITLTEM